VSSTLAERTTLYPGILPVSTASHEHRRWMHLALREAARAGEMGEVPVGSVVVLDGTIIGRGHNEVEMRGDASAHAEILAMRRAADAVGSWRLNGADLYVTLEPCPMCAGALILSRIRTLVFGARDPKFGAVGSVTNLLDDGLPWNHRLEVVEGIDADASARLLKEFFQRRRSQKRHEAPGSEGCQSG
jgi:tRNA(adenine34) deaminase